MNIRRGREPVRVRRLCPAMLIAVIMILHSLEPAVAQATSGGPGDSLAVDAEQPPVRSVIRFLTDSDYPPYNYFDEDRVLTGFNVSVARAICLELDVTCEITTRDWSDLLPALTRGEADAVIASIAKTPATLGRVSFSIPYHYTPGRFAVRSDTEDFGITPGDLAGRRVGVLAGTAHEAFVRTYFPDADVQAFASPLDARTALRLDRVALLFGDAAGLALWMNGTNARGCCGFRGEAYNEPLFFGDGVAIAARKGDHDMIGALNKGIARIRKSRRLEEIFLQFFPVRIY